MCFLRLFFTIVLFSSIASSTVQATTWYVDNGVSSNGAGTSWASPWKNFANIVWGSLAAGDTLMIAGGTTSRTYQETLTVGASGTTGTPIVILASTDPGHNGTVIIDGQMTRNNGISLSGVHDITVRGFSIQNHISAQIAVSSTSRIRVEANTLVVTGDGGVFVQTSNNVVVTGNSMTTSANTTAQTDGIYSQNNTSGNIYENNTIIISNNEPTGHDDCIQLFRDTGTTIRGNYCEHSDTKTSNSQGFIVASASGAIPIYNNVVYCPNTFNALLYYLNETGFSGWAEAYNNTLVGGKFQTLRFENALSSLAINNIIMSTQANAVLTQVTSGHPPANLHHNLYYAPNSTTPFFVATAGNESSGTGYSWSGWQGLSYDANSLNANPLLFSIASVTSSGDFRLQASSPARNSGTTLASVTTDKDGRGRPAESGYDMGAYEFVGNVTATPASEWIAHGEGVVTCKATIGSTNSDNTAPGTDVTHTPTCSLSATDALRYLRLNTVVEVCGWFRVTTAASVPTLSLKLKAGSSGTTTLASPGAVSTPSPNLTSVGLSMCWRTIITGTPGASVATYTAPLSYATAVSAIADSNGTLQPVPLATNGAHVWAVTSQWGSDTTGSNSLTMDALTVDIWR